MALLYYNMLSTKSSENTPKNISKKFNNEDEENFFFWSMFRDLRDHNYLKFDDNKPFFDDINALCRFSYEGIIYDKHMKEIIKELREQFLRNLELDVYSNEYFIKFVQYDECSRKEFEEEGKPEFCELFDEYVNDYINNE